MKFSKRKIKKTIRNLNVEKINKTIYIAIAICGLILVFVSIELKHSKKQLEFQLGKVVKLQDEKLYLEGAIRSTENYLPTSREKSISEQVEEEIRRQATEAGFDEWLAVRFAMCESSLNPFAKSSYSSARGVYQFLAGTWSNYCMGDVFNFKDNIKCFMEQFPKHPDWWKQTWSCAGYVVY